MLKNFSVKQKKTLRKIIIAIIIYILLIVFSEAGAYTDRIHPFVMFLAFAVPYLIAGYPVLAEAFVNIRHGQVFDENFLMMIATFGAFAVGENKEAVAVILFYQIGELFQDYAVEKSRRSISEMMDISPEYANLEVGSNIVRVDPEGVETGSIIVIRPGERIPLDGIVLDGSTSVDTSALTGESVPRDISAGDEVFSGCINGGGTIRVRTTSEYVDSTVARILELVEDASMNKARMENFITRFSKYYTPVVTIGAVLLGLIPPLVLGGGWMDWVQRACIFLIVSCPCALVISVPMGFFGGIGAASRCGIMVKGSNYLEAAAGIKALYFDKTGTVTKGEFEVAEITAFEGSEDELLELAALAESCSTHPAARSVVRKYGKAPDMNRVSGIEEIAGNGVKAVVDGMDVLAGSARLLQSNGIDVSEYPGPGTVVYIAVSGRYAGSIAVNDSVKDNAAEMIRQVHSLGVERTVMLTGDRLEAAERIAEQAGIDEVYAGLLPADKVRILEESLKSQKDGAKTGFIGDGINDAPVLMRADVGIAMGNMGSDAAVEAADIVIMDDELSRVGTLIKIARRTMRIVKENIVFALSVKLLVLILGAIGMANMWEAVFADVGVAVIAILNSMRAIKVK